MNFNPMYITFGLYLVLVLGIGVTAYLATKNFNDYMLGGRSLGAFVTAMSAGASDGASAVATGLTADSLSDPGSEYAVVSIPEGLDAGQSEVLSAFVAYDRASWKAVRDMDGTGEVEATATGQKLADFTKEYKDQEATGQHVEGSSSAEVLAVDLMPDNLTASVGVCNDLTRAKLVSASGEDQTPEDVPHRFPMSYILMREGSGWKVANSSHGEADQC